MPLKQPQTSWEQLEKLIADYGPTVAIVIVVLLVLWFVRKNWPLISGAVKMVDLLVSLDKNLVDIKGQLDDHGQRLERVEHELKPNSGKSLRDSTNRIEDMVRSVDTRTEKAEKRLETVEKTLSEHLAPR